jgi:hypothetical protein
MMIRYSLLNIPNYFSVFRTHSEPLMLLHSFLVLHPVIKTNAKKTNQ